MALLYGIKTLDIIAFLSEWGSFKKCLASITHENAMAVEMIYNNDTNYWPFFKQPTEQWG